MELSAMPCHGAWHFLQISSERTNSWMGLHANGRCKAAQAILMPTATSERLQHERCDVAFAFVN
ncbi:MAG: hypothetical protein RR857_19455, partial [Comamonas sp.]|uniref:hypothetical protein n=1 Tax=Comamonas sp. TaxID=34028 RepID=UPI002FCB6154